MYGLRVTFEGTQDGTRVDVEDLDETAVVARNDELAVVAKSPASGRELEAGDGLDDAAGL